MILPDPSAVDNYQPTLEGSQAFSQQYDPELSSYYQPKDGVNVAGEEEEEQEEEQQHVYDPNQRLTPVKFSSPHVRAVFSAGGILAKVDAKSPLDGQTATVELHSLQSILSQGQSREYQELQEFPGPLVPGRLVP